MRAKAASMGMRLSDHGLIDQASKKKIKMNSEKDLFDLLEIKYEIPTKR